MIRRDDDGERELAFYVDVDLSEADPFGLSVGRFYQRHPTGKFVSGGDVNPEVYYESTPWDNGRIVGKHQAAKVVASWTHGAHIIGAVPSFDTISLDALLRNHQHIPSWHYHLIDVENLAVGWLAGQRAAGMALRDEAGDLAPPWDSRQIGLAVGIKAQSEEDKHTALGDARWARDVYDAVMGVH